jgi:hypothetical protein
MWLLMGEGDGRARAREGVLIGNGLLAAFNSWFNQKGVGGPEGLGRASRPIPDSKRDWE